MRKIIGFAFVLAAAAYLIFGNTVTDVDYTVKTEHGVLPTQFANKSLAYHVPGVVRIAGADIYRPEGYFRQTLVKLPKDGTGQVAGAFVKALTLGVPTKLDAKKAKLLGLEPDFTFWEEKGKWVLLSLTICLLCLFFWR